MRRQRRNHFPPRPSNPAGTNMSVSLPNDPARDDVLAGRPALWLNPGLKPGGIYDATLPIRPTQVREAEANWLHLAPLLKTCFPELEASDGKINSKLIEAKALRTALGY